MSAVPEIPVELFTLSPVPDVCDPVMEVLYEKDTGSLRHTIIKFHDFVDRFPGSIVAVRTGNDKPVVLSRDITRYLDPAALLLGEMRLRDAALRQWPEWHGARLYVARSLIADFVRVMTSPSTHWEITGDFDAYLADRFPSRKSKVGRKEEWNWDDLKESFLKLCADKGWPDEPDNDWPHQADAERWLIKQSKRAHRDYSATAKNKGREVSESRSREKISEWMKGRKRP